MNQRYPSTLVILCLLLFVASSCVSSEDGVIGDALPRECYPEVIDEPPPPPGPCRDDVSCRRAASSDQARTPADTETLLALALPSAADCQLDAAPFRLHKDGAHCVIALDYTGDTALDGWICQPTLIHEFAATIESIAVQLDSFDIEGASLLPPLPLRWRMPDWMSSYAWQVQAPELCTVDMPPSTGTPALEMQVRMSLDAWESLASLGPVTLVVPVLKRPEHR